MYLCRMSLPVLLLRGSGKITLASYEYNINTYFTPFMDVTVKQPVWSSRLFLHPQLLQIEKISTFLVSIVIGTCVGLAFFLFGSSILAL